MPMAQSTTASLSAPSPASQVEKRPTYERRRNEASRPAGIEPLSRLQVPDDNELDPRLTDVFAEFTHSYGFVPNWLRALSINPDTALRIVQFYRHLFDPARSQLSAAERELIAVVSSATNHCSYAVFDHTRGLAAALDDDVRARRIAFDHHHVRLSKREQVLADIAEKLTAQPASVGLAELDRLRQAGFDEPAALEVLEIAAFFNYANRLTIALNIVPDAQFFAH
ncbi:MAG TPA: peroxidase-related enzyme [Polyangiaceae bacterium]|nr:peroxidase-related enzyme [Polyangiaceae bacterium]